MSTPDSMPSVSGSSSTRTTMRLASTVSTMPERRQTTQAPESLAATYSMPVPTMGASVRIRGTAWRCMFAPMRARFASSFSRKGISEAATETTCLGLTSMRVTLSRETILVSPA